MSHAVARGSKHAQRNTTHMKAVGWLVCFPTLITVDLSTANILHCFTPRIGLPDLIISELLWVLPAMLITRLRIQFRRACRFLFVTVNLNLCHIAAEALLEDFK